MGYYVSYDMDVTFKEEDEPAMLAAINALHEPALMEAQAHGGKWEGGKCARRWYSWTENPPEGGFTRLEEALNAWSFGLHGSGIGQCSISFEGEKCGDEGHLFAALAPFLTGEILAQGEDGHEWGYRFKDGRMIELICNKNWTEAL